MTYANYEIKISLYRQEIASLKTQLRNIQRDLLRERRKTLQFKARADSLQEQLDILLKEQAHHE